MRWICISLLSLGLGACAAEKPEKMPASAASHEPAPATPAPTPPAPSESNDPPSDPPDSPDSPTVPPDSPTAATAPTAAELGEGGGKAWSCLCYSRKTDAGAEPVTACREDPKSCAQLEARATAGSTSIVPASLAVQCMIVRADHPGDRLGGRAAWSPSARPGAWVSPGACHLPRGPGAGRPETLAALRREYEGAPDPDEPDDAVDAARELHKIDYRATIVAATRGDAEAMKRLLALELDGAGAEIHAQNLHGLMLGLGDAAFSAALTKQKKATIAKVLGELDWYEQDVEPGDPSHYRSAFPKTYAVGPHEAE